MAIFDDTEMWATAMWAIPIGMGILIALVTRLFNAPGVQRFFAAGLALIAELGIAVASYVLCDHAWDDAANDVTYGIDTMRFTSVGLGLAVIANTAFLIAVVFSIGYINHRPYDTYFGLLLTCQGGMMLVFGATDFFMLFIGWELMALSGYGLVSFYAKGIEPVEAAFKYLVMSSFGSLAALFGMALLYASAGTLSFAGLRDAPQPNSYVTALIVSMMLIGFGVTAGMIFANQWLPDAHPAAPAPVSMILSGSVVVAGIYGLFQTLNSVYPALLVQSTTYVSKNLSNLIMLIALLTMTEGNLMVFAQLKRKDSRDFKRILAYSTTVHMAYLMLALGVGSVHAMQALVFHVLNHALAKGMLFLLAGYVLHVIHSRELKDVRKVIRNDPWLIGVFFIGAFSLGGVPGTGGFVSKLYILLALGEKIATASGGDAVFLWFVLIAAIVNSAIAFIGYIWLAKIVGQGAISEEDKMPKTTQTDSKWALMLMKATLVVLSLTILVLGVYWSPVMELIIRLLGNVS